MAHAQRNLGLIHKVTVAAACIFSDTMYLNKTVSLWIRIHYLFLCLLAEDRNAFLFSDRQEARLCMRQYSSPSHAQTYMGWWAGKTDGEQQGLFPGNKRLSLGDPKQQSQQEGRVHRTELQKHRQSLVENHFGVAQPILFLTLQTQRTEKNGKTEKLWQKAKIPRVETILRSVSSQCCTSVCVTKALPSSSQNEQRGVIQAESSRGTVAEGRALELGELGSCVTPACNTAGTGYHSESVTIQVFWKSIIEKP